MSSLRQDNSKHLTRHGWSHMATEANAEYNIMGAYRERAKCRYFAILCRISCEKPPFLSLIGNKKPPEAGRYSLVFLPPLESRSGMCCWPPVSWPAQPRGAMGLQRHNAPRQNGL